MSKNNFEMENYVLYEKPSDFPTEYVVRKWIIGKDEIIPSPGIIVKSTRLEDIHNHMEPMQLFFLVRSLEDDPCIMGVWI